MRCPSCRGELREGEGSWGYEGLGFERVPALVCQCGEMLMAGPDVEEAEERIAQRLVAEERRDPRTIRFITLQKGVRPAEFVRRFPTLNLAEVRGWRHGVGTVPDAAVAWAYRLFKDGWGNDSCVCGECD